jgi:hypothetical protein
MAATGLYRDSDGWVTVKYDKQVAPIPRNQYIANGYQPPYDQLLTQEQYNDAQQKADFAAIEKEAGKTPQERSS